MRKTTGSILSLLLVFVLTTAESCDKQNMPSSTSGVMKATVNVPMGSDGLTTEQRNIKERLVEDNKPGSIKHLYVISAYSGQVLIYSTVRGKVTSGGKRLAPSTVVATPNTVSGNYYDGFAVNFGDRSHATGEALQDDGAYGHSMDYLYWWDTKGIYHQHYVSGGQIVHVSNQPLAVKSIIINMEITQKQE